MLKTYQWNSKQLQKKSQLFSWLMLLAGAMALASMYLWSAYIALFFVGFGMLSFLLSWRVQSKDKKLGELKK